MNPDEQRGAPNLPGTPAEDGAASPHAARHASPALAATDDAMEPARANLVAKSEGPRGPIASESHSEHRAQPLGHFLPKDMARVDAERIMKAEAMWRAGVLTVEQIAKECGRHVTLVFTWAREYHWPSRVDAVQRARAALNLEVLRKAMERKRVEADASSEAPADPAPTQTPAAPADALPSNAVNLAQVREQKPFTEEEARTRARSEQASADALAEQTTRMFVEVLSQVVEGQQTMANELAAWGQELMADARAHHAEYKRKLAEAGTRRKPSTKAISEGIGHFQRVTQAMKTVIDIQRRVWMLDAGGGGSSSSSDDDARSGPELPVNSGSYEDYVHAAERSGRNLTPA